MSPYFVIFLINDSEVIFLVIRVYISLKEFMIALLIGMSVVLLIMYIKRYSKVSNKHPYNFMHINKISFALLMMFC